MLGAGYGLRESPRLRTPEPLRPAGTSEACGMQLTVRRPTALRVCSRASGLEEGTWLRAWSEGPEQASGRVGELGKLQGPGCLPAGFFLRCRGVEA